MIRILAIRHSKFNSTHSAQGYWQPSYTLLGALLGIGGGVLAVLLVPLLWFSGWLLHDAKISSLSTLIAYFVLPLLVIGAWCLDALEKTQQPSATSEEADDDDDNE